MLCRTSRLWCFTWCEPIPTPNLVRTSLLFISNRGLRRTIPVLSRGDKLSPRSPTGFNSPMALRPQTKVAAFFLHQVRSSVSRRLCPSSMNQAGILPIPLTRLFSSPGPGSITNSPASVIGPNMFSEVTTAPRCFRTSSVSGEKLSDSLEDPLGSVPFPPGGILSFFVPPAPNPRATFRVNPPSLGESFLHTLNTGENVRSVLFQRLTQLVNLVKTYTDEHAPFSFHHTPWTFDAFVSLLLI